MSKKATEFQKKSMSLIYRGKEIFKPLNTGWIDENIACVREYVANIFFYRKNGATIMIDAGYNYERLEEKMRWLGISPSEISHILITHQDTDHVGAVESDSPGLFRNAKLYISEIENRYLIGEVRRNGRVESIDTKKIKIGQLCDSHSNEKFIREIFDKTKCRVDYEPNMGDYLLSHAAFVIPAAFICYYSGGDLHKLKNNTEILNRLIDANIEGYRAVEKSGHEILPTSDKNYESDKYRRFCMRFFKFMFATNLGKICASTHAFNAAEEISTLNRDIK